MWFSEEPCYSTCQRWERNGILSIVRQEHPWSCINLPLLQLQKFGPSFSHLMSQMCFEDWHKMWEKLASDGSEPVHRHNSTDEYLKYWHNKWLFSKTIHTEGKREVNGGWGMGEWERSHDARCSSTDREEAVGCWEIRWFPAEVFSSAGD